MFDKVMEGKEVRHEMSDQFCMWAHNFVLENTTHLQDLRSYNTWTLQLLLEIRSSSREVSSIISVLQP